MTSFFNFANGPFEQYVRFFRANGSVWVFQHIPKTAGTSLTHELAHTLMPYRNVFTRPESEHMPNVVKAMGAEVDAFLREHRTREYASVSGHFHPVHLRQICDAVPSARVFTFLRDPADRLISDYRYARTPKHPPHREFARRYPTLEAYVDDPKQHNKMWRFLFPGSRPFGPDVLTPLFRRYAFIGLTRDLSTHFGFLTGLTTCPRVVTARANATVAQADNAVDVSPELRRRIEALNGDDYAVYAAVEDVLKRKDAQMRAFIEDRRAYFAGGPAPS